VSAPAGGKRGRVFSGIRPTGRTHIGNYLGAIRNYVALQQDYDCVYCVVDFHALTTLEDTSVLQDNIRNMVLDLLAAGIDPQRSILFAQSQVPEVAQLHLLLSMVTPLGWLMRVPTFKEKVREIVKAPPDTADEALALGDEHVNYGLLGYPVLMTADIILYKAQAVPVGQDQLPHLELAREIVRRFHSLFGPTFPEPQAKLTEAPIILGLDGKAKMSKSLNNHIEVASTPEETKRRVMTAVTDPQRIRRTDPGRPEVCNVFSLHKFFTPERVAEIDRRCRAADIGCVECKGILADSINRDLAPFRGRRAELAARPGYVDEVLADGARRARAIARQTIGEVREKMGLRA
jgi:tryptophanyl-tRNA synthetase